MCQKLSGEFLDAASGTIGLREGIVLLRSTSGQWLEPVSIMGDTEIHGPLFHSCSDISCSRFIEEKTSLDGVVDHLTSLAGEVLTHGRPVEDIATIVVGCLGCWRHTVYGGLLERLFNGLESAVHTIP